MFRYAGDVILGNMVLRDPVQRRRLFDAWGPDVIKYLNDFVRGNSQGAAGELDLDWTVTRVEAGAGESTFQIIDGVGGIARIQTDAAENDGVNAQAIGEAFKLAAGVACYFGARLKVDDATQSDFFVGLAITDTDVLGGVTDRIGFEKLDGVTDVKAMLEKDSVETLSPSLLVLDTNYHTLEWFVAEDGSIEFFIDGVSVWSGMSVANKPDDEDLRVTLQFLTGAAAAKNLQIDWINCIQIGGRS